MWGGGGLTPSAEVQSEYSTVSTDWTIGTTLYSSGIQNWCLTIQFSVMTKTISMTGGSQFFAVGVLKSSPTTNLLDGRGIISLVNCPGYNIKPHDSEAPALEISGMKSTSSLPLLPGPL